MQFGFFESEQLIDFFVDDPNLFSEYLHAVLNYSPYRFMTKIFIV